MKPKFFLLGFLILLSIFAHYSLKNDVVMTARENYNIMRELNSERAINKDLKSEYYDLQTYSRVVSIASEKLGMVFLSNDPEHVQIIHDNSRDNRKAFTLIDHIIPSAAALTKLN
jgi:cell division protein FtsL